MLTKAARKTVVQPLEDVFRIEATFPIRGSGVMTRDHSYQLFGAVTTHAPSIHSQEDGVAIFPISGLPYEPTTMLLVERSRLRFRIRPEQMPQMIKLAGKCLGVCDAKFIVGVPQIGIVNPSPSLQAKVTFAGIVEPDAVLETCRERLKAMKVKGQVAFRDPTVVDDRHMSRRVVRIAGAAVVCHWIVVSGLKDDDSLRLQYSGLGGRRHFGCGIFTPYTR